MPKVEILFGDVYKRFIDIACIGILPLLIVKTNNLTILVVVIAYDIMCFLWCVDNFEKDRKFFGIILKVWKKNSCLIAAF